ncbi:hypothetical protein OSB04_024912 [Centaurea solstitialis]|uniref:Retrotransposon protein, putative, Ty1-copia subclass n=1 Tax=Centaurea solstitialis TaxID=347529 RepID=A0AA38SM17_9ASTR|nr:hypothetical protein OSB04_024912 [Centaurea solstitialis]
MLLLSCGSERCWRWPLPLPPKEPRTTKPNRGCLAASPGGDGGCFVIAETVDDGGGVNRCRCCRLEVAVVRLLSLLSRRLPCGYAGRRRWTIVVVAKPPMTVVAFWVLLLSVGVAAAVAIVTERTANHQLTAGCLTATPGGGCGYGVDLKMVLGDTTEAVGASGSVFPSCLMSYTTVPFYSPEESLRLIMGKWKLTGQNYPVWKLHLDNVLRAQGKLYVIDKPLSRPKSNAPEKEFAEYFKFMADESDVMSIMSFSASPEYTVDLRVKFCHEVVKSIEDQVGFYKNSGKYLIMKEIFSLKLKRGQSVKDHLLEIRRLFKCLSRLEYKMIQEELVYLMWFSLRKEIHVTASGYMGEPRMDVTKVYEDILDSLEPKEASAELMDTTDWIDELVDLSCPEYGSQDICFHSFNAGQMDIGLPDAPGIFMIDCLITSYESWVLDTGSGNHICNHFQGFNTRETLRKDRSNLRVGEGTMLVAEAVGSYSLSLSSSLVLELETCYYVPKMIKNILSFDLYGYVYLIRHKSETFEKFKEFQSEVQNQLDRKIKFLSIILGHALETAANILNKVPTKSVEKIPYELWTGKKPKLSFLKIWGCEVYVKLTTSEKLKPKSDKCIFVGHPKNSMGYYFYNLSENKVFVARNGEFLEEKFLNQENTRNDIDLQIVDEDTPAPIVEPVTKQDNDGGDVNEPTSYGEVVSGSESEQWQEAMKAEMQSMYNNQVWELTDLPQHCRAVGRKWVFKKKTDMDGNVHNFKARLVAKGFTQTHGIDYDETFSPVAMLKSIRILMAISAYFNSEIWQMDVKTAFLNGKLTEDVYMQQPEGFVDPKNPNKVCKLLKSIFGLKQASRSWNLHFDERIKEFGFAKSEFEPCVYTKFSGSIVTFLVLYVDDILLIGNDIPTLQSVKAWLSKCFQMKGLGEAAYILGIKIYRNRSRRLIGLNQSTCIDKVLKRFRMDESKKGFIPMQHGIVLSKAQCPESSQDKDKIKSTPYASAIGSIMYAMLCTRPDVAYLVNPLNFDSFSYKNLTFGLKSLSFYVSYRKPNRRSAVERRQSADRTARPIAVKARPQETQHRAAPQLVVAAPVADHKTTRLRHQLGGGGRTPTVPTNHRGRTTRLVVAAPFTHDKRTAALVNHQAKSPACGGPGWFD